MRVWARWVQGLIIKLMNFFATLKMLNKEETHLLEKCYGHVNIATAFSKRSVKKSTTNKLLKGLITA